MIGCIGFIHTMLLFYHNLMAVLQHPVSSQMIMAINIYYKTPFLHPMLNISQLYHGLAIYTEITFVIVHHAQMSTFVIEVCLWYIGFVLVFISSFHYKD